MSNITIAYVAKALIMRDQVPEYNRCDIDGCTNPISHRHSFANNHEKPMFSIIAVCDGCNNKIIKMYNYIREKE